KDVGKNKQYFLISDGKGKYAHGETIKEAKEDLIYKISNRDKSEFKNLDVNKKMPYEKCIEVYRVITGACAEGVKNFVKTNEIKKQDYTIQQMSKLTIGN